VWKEEATEGDTMTIMKGHIEIMCSGIGITSCFGITSGFMKLRVSKMICIVFKYVLNNL
jgi:hypothetical protein